MESIQAFKAIILMMLFYSFAITLFTHSLVSNGLLEPIDLVTAGSDYQYSSFDINDTLSDVESSYSQQKSIPLVELGALVLYSGNFFIDLLGNFVFAFAEMFGFLVWGVTSIFSIDSSMVMIVQAFMASTLIIFYIIGLIQLLVGVRSGRIV